MGAGGAFVGAVVQDCDGVCGRGGFLGVEGELEEQSQFGGKYFLVSGIWAIFEFGRDTRLKTPGRLTLPFAGLLDGGVVASARRLAI
jgi:hypothetical protein